MVLVAVVSMHNVHWQLAASTKKMHFAPFYPGLNASVPHCARRAAQTRSKLHRNTHAAAVTQSFSEKAGAGGQQQTTNDAHAARTLVHAGATIAHTRTTHARAWACGGCRHVRQSQMMMRQQRHPPPRTGQRPKTLHWEKFNFFPAV